MTHRHTKSASGYSSPIQSIPNKNSSQIVLDREMPTKIYIRATIARVFSTYVRRKRYHTLMRQIYAAKLSSEFRLSKTFLENGSNFSPSFTRTRRLAAHSLALFTTLEFSIPGVYKKTNASSNF